eukprot:6193671-Pleurochrysis_carterae.AAC.3
MSCTKVGLRPLLPSDRSSFASLQGGRALDSQRSRADSARCRDPRAMPRALASPLLCTQPAPARRSSAHQRSAARLGEVARRDSGDATGRIPKNIFLGKRLATGKPGMRKGTVSPKSITQLSGG